MLRRPVSTAWIVGAIGVLIALLVAGVVALTVVYPMAIFGFILVLVPLIGMVRDFLIWQNREYIVTNRRVIQISGRNADGR